MKNQTLQVAQLGSLTKIGRGGQGVVYRAERGRTKFADIIVYKEYKARALAEINFETLAAIPSLVERGLTTSDAERLIGLAAWPCAIVESGGSPTGFVMPVIPDRFFIPIETVKGSERAPAEFQHLLNDLDVIAARGINLNQLQRLQLISEIASALAFLHRNGICIGDVSPKNLLFSLETRPAVYFVDCDAVRINGKSALPQIETPGWEAPAGEELATVYSDTYKLGLLALRLMVGDQDVTDPRQLPPTTPNLLRRLIIDALESQPQSRPLPQAWRYILDDIVAQDIPADATSASRETASQRRTPSSPPPRPTMRSRPSGHQPGSSSGARQGNTATPKVKPTVLASPNATASSGRSTLGLSQTPAREGVASPARWYGSLSPQRQIWVNAALLVPTFVLRLIMWFFVVPTATRDSWHVANEIHTVVYGMYFIGVIAMVTRGRARLYQALTAAGIVVALDIIFSWPRITGATGLLIFNIVCVGYVAAWGVARRCGRSWIWGLLLSVIVCTLFRSLIYSSDYYGPIPAWSAFELMFVIGCLLCWGIDGKS